MPQSPIAATVLQPYKSNSPVDVNWLSSQLRSMTEQREGAKDLQYKTELLLANTQPLARDKKQFEQLVASAKPFMENLARQDITPGQAEYESRKYAREVGMGIATIGERATAAATTRDYYENQGFSGPDLKRAMGYWERNNLDEFDIEAGGFGTINPSPRILADPVDIPSTIMNYAKAVDKEEWTAIFANGTFDISRAYANFGEDNVNEAIARAGIDKNNVGLIGKMEVKQLTADMIRRATEHAIRNDPKLSAYLEDQAELQYDEDPEKYDNQLAQFKQLRSLDPDITEEERAMFLSDDFDVQDMLIRDATIDHIDNAVNSKARTTARVTIPSVKAAAIKKTPTVGTTGGIRAPSNFHSFFEGGGRKALEEVANADLDEMDAGEKKSYYRNKRILEHHTQSFKDRNIVSLTAVANQIGKDLGRDFDIDELVDMYKSPSGLFLQKGAKGVVSVSPGGQPAISYGADYSQELKPEYAGLSEEVMDLIRGERTRYELDLDNYSGDGELTIMSPEKNVASIQKAGYSMMRNIVSELIPVSGSAETKNTLFDFWWGGDLVDEEEGEGRRQAMRTWIVGDNDTGPAYVTRLKSAGEFLPMEITMERDGDNERYTFQVLDTKTQGDVLRYFGEFDKAENNAWYAPVFNDAMDKDGAFEIPNTSQFGTGSNAVISQATGSGVLHLTVSGADQPITLQELVQEMGDNLLSLMEPEEQQLLKSMILQNYLKHILKSNPKLSQELSHDDIWEYIEALATPSASGAGNGGDQFLASLEKTWPEAPDALRKAAKAPVEFTQRGQAVRLEELL